MLCPKKALHRSQKGRKDMQLICPQRQGRDKKYIGNWKLLQAVHQKLLCNNSPSTRIVEKWVHFRWDDEQEDAFIKLKEALCKDPVLAYPDPDLPYVVDTDASNLAISVVLSQVQDSGEKVIMYGSKAFSGSQRQWCTTRRILFAIIHFVMVKLYYYFLNQEFTLRTDQSSLR